VNAIPIGTVNDRRTAVIDANPPGSDAALRAVMVIHTAIWFSIEACMVYVLYAGFAGRSDRRVGIAAGVVAAESLIFVGNGCRCPLTSVAERLGIERGSVTDLYLPCGSPATFPPSMSH